MAKQKIHLSGSWRAHELPAAGTLKPGMLVQENSSGNVEAHSTAGGFAERMFVQEDALQGKTISDTYAAGDRVSLAIEQRGSMIQALLLAGSNYTVGTKLISDSAGRLKPTTGTPDDTIGIVITALDLSASGAVDTLGEISVL